MKKHKQMEVHRYHLRHIMSEYKLVSEFMGMSTPTAVGTVDPLWHQLRISLFHNLIMVLWDKLVNEEYE